MGNVCTLGSGLSCQMCQSCDEKPQSAPGSPPTHCRLLQVLVLTAVQEHSDTTFLRLCDLCDLCLTSSPNSGNQHCTFCLWAQSLAPSRRDSAVVFVFCVWLISLNTVSSEFILSFHKLRISFMAL